MKSSLPIPIALTIAGSDSGGGAGIQADLKTFAALGVYGCSAITALTAQNTQAVSRVLAISSEFVREQIQTVLSDIKVAAIKTGMLVNADIIAVLVDILAQYPKIPLVLDPVMVSSSGHSLLAHEASTCLMETLMPRACLITPNLDEAAALLKQNVAGNLREMRQQAEQLLALGAQAVLIKGGHATGPEAVDLLATVNGVELFRSPRIATRNSHGTGCTLASAIAAGLAKQLPLHAAIAQAKDYLHNSLVHAKSLTIGQGAGPVHHFYHYY